MLVVNDIDRISGLCGQISDNMAKANQGKSGYSKEAIKEISKLFDVLSGLYEAVHRSIVMGNVTAMQKSMDDKEELVRLDDKIRAAHMKRVGKGLCDASLTISLNELLHDVERIGNTCLDLMEMASQEINFSKFLIDKKKSAGDPPAVSGQRPKLQA
jgi:phosphate:Na+ symporter